MFSRLKDLIREVINKLFNKNTIQDKLKVDIALTDEFERAIDLWAKMFEDESPWLNDDTKSMGISSSIASEMARLVTLEMETEINNNDFLNAEYQIVIDSLSNYVEFACAKGGIAFKPYVSNGHIEVDMVQADSFFPTNYNSRGEVTGAIFIEVKQQGETRYTRLEYHNLTTEGYYISNTAFEKENSMEVKDHTDLGKQIPLTDVDEWAELEEEVLIKNIDKPLFSYFKMPFANTIDSGSPLGVSIYSRVVDLIKEADKQYSRILWEYEGSELAINASVDCFKMDEEGNAVLPEGHERLYRDMNYGVGEFNKAIEVFSPSIRDTSLFNGLNNLLRRIEFNTGLAYGTLSDVQETDKTAEEIKSSKQRSYASVKKIQNQLKNSLEQLAYAMSVWARIYGLSNKLVNPDKDMDFNFDDSLVMDKDKELASMQADVAGGILRPEIYIMKKYGVSEEEALKMMPQNDNSNEPEDDEE
ncbi:UNVERIFIED_ORG: phage capsid protein [Clostridium botulinum]